MMKVFIQVMQKEKQSKKSYNLKNHVYLRLYGIDLKVHNFILSFL